MKSTKYTSLQIKNNVKRREWYYNTKNFYLGLQFSTENIIVRTKNRTLDAHNS